MLIASEPKPETERFCGSDAFEIMYSDLSGGTDFAGGMDLIGGTYMAGGTAPTVSHATGISPRTPAREILASKI